MPLVWDVSVAAGDLGKASSRCCVESFTTSYDVVLFCGGLDTAPDTGAIPYSAVRIDEREVTSSNQHAEISLRAV